MKIGYIYGLVCPVKKQIRYVGQTRDITWRLVRHKRDMLRKEGRLTHKEAWLKSLFNKNLLNFVNIVVIEKCELVVIDNREIYWISEYKKIGNLTNIAEGGNGVILKGENHPMYGKKHSAKTIKKMSDCKIGTNNPMYGRSYYRTKKTKLKLSKSLKTSNRLKTSRQDIKYRELLSDINTKHGIYILNDDFEIIKETKNCKTASVFLGCTYSNVKNARRDKRKCKGYWIVYDIDYNSLK